MTSEIERPRETTGDRVLRFRKASAIGVEAIGPDVSSAFRIDQLHVDPNLLTHPPHTAFENVANPELMPYLLQVAEFALIGKRGVASDHEASRDSRKISGQVVRNAVCEIILLRVVRKVCEAQHDDRQPRQRTHAVWRNCCGTGARLCIDPRCSRDEAIASAGHRLNVVSLRSALIEDAAERRDLNREVAVLDHGLGPDRGDDLLLRDDLARDRRFRRVLCACRRQLPKFPEHGVM